MSPRTRIVVTARVKNRRLILSKAHAENVPLTLVVDTGAQISIGNMKLREKAQPGQGEAGGGASVRHGRGNHGRVYDRPRTRGRRDHAEEHAHRIRRLACVPKAQPRQQAALLGMNALRLRSRLRLSVKVLLPETGALQMKAIALR